jgi:hypothetical protein
MTARFDRSIGIDMAHSFSRIEFLRTQRVELNAMMAPEFVAFLKRKLTVHAGKVNFPILCTA